MKNLIARAIAFIRENPSLMFSLVLIVIIPAAFFFNTHSLTTGFEKSIDEITQADAVTTENVVGMMAAGRLDDPSGLQTMVDDIVAGNGRIVYASILRPNEDHETFRVLASSRRDQVGQDSADLQYVLAWKQPEGIAFLGQDETGRFWQVTKSIGDGATGKAALVSMSLSLGDTDRLIGSQIARAYVILLFTVLIVILFVSNQARLFGYALTITKLKEVDQMKDSFIYMASHELRTPLTAIKGYLEFLQEKMRGNPDEEAQHYLENITLSAGRLETLVKDMLEVSRLEGNRIPMKIESLDPYPLVAQSIEELRSQAIVKGLELRFEEGPAASVSADKERFKQILVNLVGNAIKYTPKGSITVVSKVKDKEFLLTVADTGLGISSDEQKNLFQKFYRVKNDHTTGIVGTGLGLWITMELARRMNGTITLESIEGVGSHFTLHLPLAK